MFLESKIDFIDLGVGRSHYEDIVGHYELKDRYIEIQLRAFDLEHVERGIAKAGCEEAIVVVVVRIRVAGTSSSVGDNAGRTSVGV